jgi:DNA-binding transcriptional regulator YiaG
VLLSEWMSHSDLILRYEGRQAVASGRVRSLRVSAKLSQGDVAHAVGVSPACVSRWESRNRLPRAQAAERLARLLRDLERAVAA